MVGITIDCRLGNQLFQYAFIKTVSERWKTSFFINEKSEKFLLPEYFHLKGYSSLTNNFKKIILKLQQDNPLSPMQNVQVDEVLQIDPENFPNKKMYRGYFQSELFFKLIAPKISSYIEIKKIYY